MPNRAHTFDNDLSELVTELGDLDARREALMQRIGRVIETMAGGLPSSRLVRRAAKAGRGSGGRPKGYKVSAATRAKLRAAWKRRKASAGA
jgi:hypothetical protein